MTDQTETLPTPNQEQVTIETLARVQFTPADVAIMLNDEYAFDLFTELTTQLVNKSGPLYEQYNKGRLLGEYENRRSIMIMATQGSTPAQALMKDMIALNRAHLEEINAL